ncbi:hypothetical protein [Photobacterium damselae]|uniref:hypothetical protein n=1 Tax=Photobacterium damselae TaxID=38293 RepID=UPI00165DA20C|nr:hypothetical protein [Photobacterium damselae]
MFELNFIKFMKLIFPNIPTYSFVIPEDAPADAFCFEPAGRGIATNRFDNLIESRTVKLTRSSKTVSNVFNDNELTKYIRECYQLGDIPIINARILNVHDLYDKEQRIFERTYTINFKFKEIK